MRSIERYGFFINIDQAIQDIQEGNAKFIYKTSNRVSIFIVHQNKTDLKVVYDKQRKMIATVLPLESNT